MGVLGTACVDRIGPRGCAGTEAMLLSVEVPACECMPGEADCACTTSDVPGQCGDR